MPAMEKKVLQVTTNPSPSLSQYGRRSPSLEPPAYTTDDLLAAKYDRLAGIMHWTRFGIAAVTFGTSVSIMGCAGSSLREFSVSKDRTQWILPPWPMKMDLRPINSILACAIVTTVFSLTYLILAVIPLRRKLYTLNIASTIFSVLGFALALFTVIFASVITRNFAGPTNTPDHHNASGSLLSWTCKWQGLESMAPANFTKICNTGSAALDLVLFLVLMQFCAVSAAAAGWWVGAAQQRDRLTSKSQVELV